MPRALKLLAYGLTAIVVAGGAVAVGVGASINDALEALAWLIAVGASVYLFYALFRIGLSGDRERDDEEAARRHFDEHGRWPGEHVSR
ncbi:MAG TPA: hypothetical protein VGJ70_02430 [Solirubrobacteraceae bacterium]|jgi:threonine/homoserine/homoserine lactone efflux protein